MSVQNKNVTSGDQIGLAGGANGFNNPKPYNNQSYETFDKSHTRAFTSRFAEIKPTLAITAKAGDVIKLRMKHTSQNLPMQNEFKGSITKSVSYYQVPLSAIMPRNWDKLTQQPTEGDDVPDDAYCNMSISNLITSLTTILVDEIQTVSAEEIFYAAALLYSILNSDSVLSNMGYQPTWTGTRKRKKEVVRLTKEISKILIDTIQYKQQELKLQIGDEVVGVNYLYPDMTLSQARDVMYKIINGTYEVKTIENFTGSNPLFDLERTVDELTQAMNVTWENQIFTPKVTRLVAYQQICAQYFTNDKIDPIHSAKEWLDNMESYATKILGNIPTFTYNGQTVLYDVMSKRVFDEINEVINEFGSSFNDRNRYCYYFFLNMFSYQDSLRFNDYFTESRTRPLAVGDVTAPVISGKVSAIDMNMALWKQRWLNFVNRSSGDIYEYLKELTGTEPVRKITMPYHLATERYGYGQEQTQNTTEEGLGTTAITLRSEGDRYEFTFQIDEKSEIIGVTSYNVTSLYTNLIERVFNNQTRDDEFNEFMQHFGDQAVYGWELDGVVGEDSRVMKFGYQVRYAELKYMNSYVTGAFKDTLKSWLAWDNYGREDFIPVINSEFIRNQNQTIDEIFASNTGKSNEDYFHFIDVYEYDIKVNSKMQKNPSLI